MKFVLKVVSIGPTEIKQGPKSSYSMFELTYKRDNKTQNKKIFSFNKEIFSVLANAQPGQHYEVEQEKKGEYWEWMSVATVDSPEEGEPAPTAKPSGGGGGFKKGGEFRTPEQIIRSTALEQAVAYLAGVAGTKVDKTAEGAVALAVAFEDYLTNGATTASTLKDDIPFDVDA